jgi:hypothetical protein
MLKFWAICILERVLRPHALELQVVTVYTAFVNGLDSG